MLGLLNKLPLSLWLSVICISSITRCPASRNFFHFYHVAILQQTSCSCSSKIAPSPSLQLVTYYTSTVLVRFLDLLHILSHAAAVERTLVNKAAIGSHPFARHYLVIDDLANGRFERAANHFIIAPNQGDGKSVEMLKQGYKERLVSKEDFAAALCAQQAAVAVDAMKSPQREAAEKARWRDLK